MKNSIAITIICFLVMNMQTVFAQGFIPFERNSEYKISPPASPTNNGGSGTSFVPFQTTQMRSTVDTCPKCDTPLWGGAGTPCPNCNHSTEGQIPVGGGFLILTGLAIFYGFFKCRIKRNTFSTHHTP